MTPSSFQARVHPWLMECFGPMIAGDKEERNHRFLEEALELVQACGCTRHEAHQLVDYVYGRPVGDRAQETGGVMVTLAALCLAQGIDMHAAGEVELARIWTKVEQIRAKQAAKPKHSPLPEGKTDQYNGWRVVLIDELVSCGILTKEHERDPKKALQDVIQWNVETALDPAVSEAARALQKGDKAALGDTEGGDTD